MTGRAARFAGSYALANIGAFLCFVPLIGLSLPQRMTELAGDDAAGSLSWALLLGALVASAANIAAGALSDRWLRHFGGRLGLVRIGLALTMLSFAGLITADSPDRLIAAFLCFQLCFNLLFAPLSALVTDYVGDNDKGKMFGILSLALPLAQASIFVIVTAGLDRITTQLSAVAAVAVLAMLPLLMMTPPALIAAQPAPAEAGGVSGWYPRDFMLAWVARLAVQCASVAIGSYLFLHLTRLAAMEPSAGPAALWMGRYALVGAGAGLLTGLAVGMASDQLGRRRLFLWPMALAVSAGSAVLAATGNPLLMGFGYAVFAFGLAGFLTVDGAMVAQLVAPLPGRAAALGVMNLTNTLSAVLIPAAALLLEDASSIPTTLLFGMASAGALIAAALVAMIRSID